MPQTKGSEGYTQAVDRFVEATLQIDFEVLHAAFLAYMPDKPGRILDLGAGIGRDAYAFAEMGHSVVAVEPTWAFLEAAKRRYDSPRIQWVHGALPDLANLVGPFEFVLASAVWHHLDDVERLQTMSNIVAWLQPQGIFAVSLRHGPAGVGTHVFPTDGAQTVAHATSVGLETLLHERCQPSLMPGKTEVTWTRLVFRKPE